MKADLSEQDVRRPSRSLELLASSALVLGLVACGGGKSSPAGPGGPGEGDQNLLGPQLTAAHPSAGAPTGGTVVELYGTGFAECDPAHLVRFGDEPASGVVVLSDTLLLATTPPGEPGMCVSISVQNACGEAMLTDAFTYSVLDGPPQVDPDLDLDGDGLADLAIGAPGSNLGGAGSGAVYVLLGTPEPLAGDKPASAADLVIVGAPGERFGEALLTADIDGDGIADLLVGAPGASLAGEDSGALYVFFGPLAAGSVLSAAEASLTIPGSGPGAGFGAAIAIGARGEGGQRDLLVGAPGASAAYHFRDMATIGEWEGVGAAAVTLHGVLEQDRLGAVVGLADLTGDGIDELVLGAPDAGLEHGGAVYVLRDGPTLVSSSAVTAEAVWLGAPGERLGAALAFGDLDGDGIVDLVAGAPGSSAVAHEAGRAYLFLGSETLQGGTTADAFATYSGLEQESRFGSALAIGDLDGDGYPELAVGAPLASFAAATHNGKVHIFRGGPAGPSDRVSASADTTYFGEVATGGEFGSTLGCADMDGDGKPQMIVGAPFNDAGGSQAGRVYVFRAQPGLVPQLPANVALRVTGASPGDHLGTSVTR